jgi:hypothetical protein
MVFSICELTLHIVELEMLLLIQLAIKSLINKTNILNQIFFKIPPIMF